MYTGGFIENVSRELLEDLNEFYKKSLPTGTSSLRTDVMDVERFYKNDETL